MDDCKKTPLYEAHCSLNGKMVEFGGWSLPVQYSSILEEHKAVRERCGLFDVSHMGEIFIKGTDALRFLQDTFTNDFSTLQDGRCRYSFLCYPDGGTVDDVLVYRFNSQKYMVVVNAANTAKDFAWIMDHASSYDAKFINESAQWAQLALQGPLAERVLAPLCNAALPAKNYSFVSQIQVAGVPAVVSRTGYTGEDGFEIYCEPANASALHASLLQAGAACGILPCGLGARDTLRFEASMPLYGHELSAAITPREAGLDFAIKFSKEQFIGRDALLGDPPRRRIGLQITDRGIAREHADVLLGGKRVGFTTSGGPAPTLGGNYAMALIDADAANETNYTVLVRDRALNAKAVPLPFYKR